MTRARPVLLALGAVSWWLVSCRDIGTPQGGVLSVGRVLLPSPGIVAGDTLRDSTGVVAPLRVMAFGVNGDTIVSAPATFVVLDTGAFLDGSLVIADATAAGRKVRIVGTVAGLQTRPETVKVALSPDTIAATDSLVHHRVYSAIGDSVFASADVATTVSHKGGGSVEAVIVRYAFELTPSGATQALFNGNTPSDRDTTDAAGHASRTVRIQRAKKATGQGDTTYVSAMASYRGKEIGRVRFTLIFAMP